MTQFLNENFWIYIIIAFISFGVIFYFTPKLVKFLDDFADRKKNRRRKKTKADESDEKSKNRYKIF